MWVYLLEHHELKCKKCSSEIDRHHISFVFRTAARPPFRLAFQIYPCTEEVRSIMLNGRTPYFMMMSCKICWWSKYYIHPESRPPRNYTYSKNNALVPKWSAYSIEKFTAQVMERLQAAYGWDVEAEVSKFLNDWDDARDGRAVWQALNAGRLAGKYTLDDGIWRINDEK